MRRAQRGQALTETAIVLVLFVSILLGGLYFSEVNVTALKVQEAANFALWDVTARPMHNTQDDPAVAYLHYRQSIPLAQAEAQRRYVDFDGRSRIDRAPGLSQFLSSAGPLQVTCSADPTTVTGIGPQDADRGTPPPTVVAAGIETVTGNAGIACTAQASITGRDIGSLAAGSGKETWHDTKTLCATVTCGKRIPMLLDDWGFSGAKEGRTCPLSLENAGPCNGSTNANLGYYSTVQRMYQRGLELNQIVPAQGAGTKMAVGIAGTSHIDETHFFMSYRDGQPLGQSPPWSEYLPAMHPGGQQSWETTPFNLGGSAPDYANAYNARQNFWLGNKL